MKESFPNYTPRFFKSIPPGITDDEREETAQTLENLAKTIREARSVLESNVDVMVESDLVNMEDVDVSSDLVKDQSSTPMKYYRKGLETFNIEVKLYRKLDNQKSQKEEKKEPPIGFLVPKYVRDRERIAEITNAIKRYNKECKKVPMEWVEELQDLCTEGKRRIKNTPGGGGRNLLPGSEQRTLQAHICQINRT